MNPLLVAALVIVAVCATGCAGFALGVRKDRSSVEPTGDSEDLSVGAEVARLREMEGLLGSLRDAVDDLDQGVIVRGHDGTEKFRNVAARELAEARDGRALIEGAVDELLVMALDGAVVRRELDLFGPPAQSFEVTARPFGGPAGGGALAVVYDVTLDRRTETVRRDFVANISHELKSPIGAMGLLAEMISDEADPQIVQRLALRMVGEAARANHTIDDLLELSRIEFGDETEFAAVDLSAVVDEAIGRIASAAEHAKIAVSSGVATGTVVVGDQIQLVSAVYNLLDNAVKYSPEGGTVRVAMAPAIDSETVGIEVADTGVGIPRRDLDRVFERFYRVDRARSRSTGGTGLGLAIVRHVANNHGGEVSVESTEGVGATFTLTLSSKLQPGLNRETAG